MHVRARVCMCDLNYKMYARQCDIREVKGVNTDMRTARQARRPITLKCNPSRANKLARHCIPCYDSISCPAR